jgi:hypothetical protein
LSTIFDLSIIDWLKIEEFALSNLVKQACNIKKENIELSTTEIGKRMNLNRNTIAIYLKKENQLGWCNYNAKEELNKSHATNSLRNKKRCLKVICLETNIIYEGVNDASRKTKIRLSGISQCCTGKQKTAGGYHWMHYDTYLKNEMNNVKRSS